ncbi:Uncharacterized protein APZ42_012265 [Daphnia magna]|uniref:Uncharacterized protein n=1 Tax=Daphnia magna TaxID=35525 RepID=A0A162S8T9_9CRUS|nr:Uncharacterized protein APZ42_012265 [Daphnia magna]
MDSHRLASWTINEKDGQYIYSCVSVSVTRRGCVREKEVEFPPGLTASVYV